MVAGKIVNLSTTVPKGAMIDAILETSISSDLPGQARAIVADNVYSADGSHLLIAEGSTMLGQYSSGVQQGQTGIMLVWQTLRTPDGSEIQLDSMATSPLGRSGIAGEVDNHFAERFGSAIMFSFIEGAIQVGVNAASDPEAQQVAITSGQSTSRTAEVALENSINRRPTIIVHQGDRVRAFLRNALDMTPTVQKGSRFVP
jgi:type IV secretion system protein VirB10